MEAIVLAGGRGSRLRKVISGLPKPMAPIAGRPFLELLLELLASKGFRRVVLSVGYMADKVTTHFGDCFAGIELAYEIESTPLGTGGAIRQAMGRCNADHVFIFNGDTYLDLEVEHVEMYWRQHHVPIIVAREVEDTTRYGRLETNRGRVVGFTEKGSAGPGLINAGCYLFPTDVLRDFQEGAQFSLEEDFLAQRVPRQRFDVFVSNGQFIDIGIPEDYARAKNELAELRGGTEVAWPPTGH